MEEKNYISNFDCSLWQIDDWGLYTAKSPIYINSLGSDFNVWFDVDGESFPTDKQLVAWAGFCNINSNEIKEMIDETKESITKYSQLKFHEDISSSINTLSKYQIFDLLDHLYDFKEFEELKKHLQNLKILIF